MGKFNREDYHKEVICKVYASGEPNSEPVVILSRSARGDDCLYVTQKDLDAIVSGGKDWRHVTVFHSFREYEFKEVPNAPLYKVIPNFIVQRSTNEVKQVEVVERTFEPLAKSLTFSGN